MSGNRSLDEFADAGAAAGSDDEGSPEDVDSSVDEPAEAGREDAESGSVDAGDSVADREDAGDLGGVAGESADVGADPGAGEADREAPEPPASTYVWSPGGGTCAGCGENAAERWREGDALVCAGCKEW